VDGPTNRRKGRELSVETLHALEDALQAHIASENEHAIVVSDWVLMLAGEYLEDSSRTFCRSLTNGRQPWHSTKGLVSILSDEFEVPRFDGDDD
jgi:hypothetical protein